MTEYIPKSAIVAEIKGLIRANELYLSEPYTDEVRFQKTGAYSVLNDLLHFLDTLEVKEVKEEPVSEDLEEAAKNHAVERFRTTRNEFLAEKCKWSFKAGAQWKEQQMQSTIELAEEHAMLAGMNKMEQQMVKDTILETTIVRDSDGNMEDETYQEWLEYEDNEIFEVPSWAEEGDKVKVLVIKQE